MSYILDLINANIHLAPLIAFGALIASGFSVPISEDFLNVACGLLAVRHPEMALELYLGIFLGAYISDCICYWLGRTVGNHLLFGGGRMQARKARILKKVRRHFDQHAVLALIVGRFIPFGVRNAMYLTAGVGKYSFWRFAVLDLTGCFLSTSVLFQLTRHFGEPVAESFAKGKVWLFALVAAGVLTILARYLIRRHRSKENIPSPAPKVEIEDHEEKLG